MADLTKVVVLVHCQRCGGGGMVLGAESHQLELCSICHGRGRREKHPYAPGTGEQGDDFNDLPKGSR